MPIRNMNHEITGVFQVLNKNEGDFTQKDEDLLIAIGSSAGIAIENAKKYEDNSWIIIVVILILVPVGFIFLVKDSLKFISFIASSTIFLASGLLKMRSSKGFAIDFERKLVLFITIFC